jgi:hypothetical protein
MNPAWPERIDFGQAGIALDNGRKTGPADSKIA